jgi:ATP-binding cassette subfamily B protein
LGILGVLMISSAAFWIGGLMIETLAQRLEADSRQELYTSLLGKSQTFHNRQRVGDIMARATDDVRQLNFMLSPGLRFIYETVLGIFVPLLYIAFIQFDLLLVPVLFVVTYVIAVRQYTRQLNPVMTSQREQFGKLNTGLEEVLSGIEVLKASVQDRMNGAGSAVMRACSAITSCSRGKSKRVICRFCSTASRLA